MQTWRMSGVSKLVLQQLKMYNVSTSVGRVVSIHLDHTVGILRFFLNQFFIADIMYEPRQDNTCRSPENRTDKAEGFIIPLKSNVKQR